MIFAMMAAKLTALLLRLLHKGATTLPGRVALFFKYNILTKLSRGVKIICVTGTNGKTTTCALLAHALRECGCSCFLNRSGANMITGVTTAFIRYASLTGKCKRDYAILECDENSLPEIARYIDAEIVVVTNIFRDQLDRFGEVDFTLSQIRKGIQRMPRATLVLNADDPLSFTLSALENPVLSFGVNAALGNDHLSDNRFCPHCGAALLYRSRTLAQLGDFRCPRCAYRRTPPAVFISEPSATGFLLTVKGKSVLASSALEGAYNLYNFCAAAAVLQLLGLDGVDALCRFSGAFGRMEKWALNGRTVLLLLVKNPVGLSSCIRYVSTLEEQTDIAFALNDREADSTDVSWIWDSDFTPLREKRGRVITLGMRSYDMALRLKYDGITADSVLDGECWGALLTLLKESENDAVIFATYTAMMQLRHYFIQSLGGKEFWEEQA